jgi:hypothetical protein
VTSGPRVAATALVSIGLLLAGVPAAGAATSDLQVSIDGGPFTGAPSEALFDDGYRISPGDRLTRDLRVRSTHGTPVVLTITTDNVRVADEVFARDVVLVGGEEGEEGTAIPFSLLASCSPLIAPRTVQPGEAVHVTLSLELDRRSTNVTRVDSLAFDVAIGLTDVGVPVDPSGCAVPAVVVPGIGAPGGPAAPGGQSGPLASTGGTLPYPVLIGAGLAMGVGWLLVVDAMRRRRRTP